MNLNQYAEKCMTAEEAALRIRSGDRVAATQAAGRPGVLLDALTARQDLRDVEVFHVLSIDSAP